MMAGEINRRCAAGALLLATCFGVPPTQAQSPDVVTVGVVAFEDFDEEFAKWNALLPDLARGHEPALQFQLAVGTYGDLVHWLDGELLDLAILTSGVFAGSGTNYEYMATIGLPPATSKWAQPDRRRAGYHFRYRSVCVVASASPVSSVDDLKRLADEDRLEFVFVNPFSTSGRIAPEFMLEEIGIQPDPQRVRYSYSHTGSLRLLTEPRQERHRVAFVWDDALRSEPTSADRVRRVEFPALERIDIPHDVIVARRGFRHADSLLKRLAAHTGEGDKHDFIRMDESRARYAFIRTWSETLGLSGRSGEAQTVSLDDIGRILLHAANAQPEPPRLAVVLSGGGAKCSYQAGAVSALEEKLAVLREQNDDLEGLDIGLVVGTSGGAINSVPIALGVSSTAEGRQCFRALWTELDQREMVRPARVVRTNIGLWLACLQIALVVGLVWRLCPSENRRPWVFGVVLFTLASIEIAAGYLHHAPWIWMGSNHVWHHLWLWCSFGLRASAWSLLALSVGVMVRQKFLARRGKTFRIPTRPFRWCMTVLLLALPTVQLITLFFFQETLSGGQGIEHTLAEKLPALIEPHLKRRGKPALGLEEVSPDGERLRQLGLRVLRGHLLERDLIITGNALKQTSASLPSDLYFFAAADPSSEPPPFGARGVAIRNWPSLFMDMVIGSSSIFPVFPPRKLPDFPSPGNHVELIDGGFAHNSPIEAAVLWGATHVVMIEATPAKRAKRKNFAQNLATAFVHLHRQTQLVDMRSKKQVVVFTLTPEPPHLCVIDFADNLIATSIERGYHDAVGDTPKFRKELGTPVFTTIGSREERGRP